MKYGLIGKKLGHSFSKEIHAHLADYEYELLELPDEEAVIAYLATRDFSAINVTIPYKETVMPHLDEISPEALAIGAVNTIVNRGGKLYGYNTDFYGIESSLSRMGFPALSGKKALILGTGGTARTAYAVLHAMGADTVYRVSRTPSEEAISYADAYRLHADADVIFNATPVGMYPAITGVPIDLSQFPRLSCVFDAVYNPLRTTLVSDALSLGIAAGGGLYMLVAQAFRAVELFLDTTLPPDLLSRVYRKIEEEKENIVLIGMPSAGKTTIGRMLAKKTGRTLIDLDEEIVKRAECDIPTIFRERGEHAFRDIESEAAIAISAMNGVIIATGGGAVLREENVRHLKQNGRLCFLDRPLAALTPTANRPTASDLDAMRTRYKERLPIYQRSADLTFPVGENFNDTAQAILKEFFHAYLCSERS